jgi:PAS domain S-box-containing protein
MKPNPIAPTATALRRRAEARLREGPRGRRAADKSRRAETDTQRPVHELQVHQVELEMQNAELEKARGEIEATLESYTDLYDFAPVGYFSLDERGRIMEVNLTGAALLGMERSRLLRRRLPDFVAPASQAVFLGFLQQTFGAPGPHVCEAIVLKEDGACFWGGFHASALSRRGPHQWCRVAISDITALKRADEARHRMEALAAANRDLLSEMAQRQAAEEALRKSQRDLSHLLEQSRQMQEQLRHLSHQVLQAQEEERKRISRELHDEITQTLVGINVHLEALAREATSNPAGLKKQIARTQRLVERSVHTVHEFARELRPALLDDLGIIPTLHAFMKDFTKRTGIRVHFTTCAPARIGQLGNAAQTVLYRVAQEALTNAARHAEATRVDLSIRRLKSVLLMEIKDDGRSFEVQRVLRAQGNRRLGLLGMRERVQMVGGSFAVESAPGHGTLIRAQIPFSPGGTRTTALPLPAGSGL